MDIWESFNAWIETLPATWSIQTALLALICALLFDIRSLLRNILHRAEPQDLSAIEDGITGIRLDVDLIESGVARIAARVDPDDNVDTYPR